MMSRRLQPREIGRPFGIPVRLDSSWYVIFITYVWVISRIYLPALAPGLSVILYLVLGIVTTLLFFVSVLAHEMAHSLVARAEGVGILNITLYVFGGMAHMDREPYSPMAELRIAAAGPAASLGAGILFLALELLTQQTLPIKAAEQIFHHLGWLNVILAVFNLLPGFPLDGGRMLRALLWRQSGNYSKATHQASVTGKWIAYLLMGGGLLLLPRNWELGISSCLIGGLLVSLLHQSLPPIQNVPTSTQAHPTRFAGDAIFSQPITVTPDTFLKEFMLHILPHHPHSTFPVVSQRRLYGILSVDRLRAIPQETWAKILLSEVMEPVHAAVFVSHQTPLGELETLLTRNGLGHAAVLDRDGLVIGYVSLSDVHRAKNSRP